MFTKLKKGKNAGSEIVSHKFITYEDKDEKGENKSYFEFVPLLLGSNRESYKNDLFLKLFYSNFFLYKKK